MKKMVMVLLIASMLFSKYTLTITVETETIKEAGKVEEIVMDELKKYGPEIDIKKNHTLTLDSCLFIGSINDTLRSYMPAKPEYWRMTPNTYLGY